MDEYKSNQVWWDKNTIPKNASSEEFLSTIKARCDKLHEELASFRQDSKRYERNVHYRTNVDEVQRLGQQDKMYQSVFEDDPYLTFNVTQAAVETASNKIAKLRPKVTFLTKGADREKRETARRLDNWMLRLFKRGNVYGECALAFTSACVTGLGVIKLIYKSKADHDLGEMKAGVEFKNVSVHNIFFDHAYKGPQQPTEMGEQHHFTLHDLVMMFPEKKKELKAAYNGENTILVYEVYKAHKRHAIFTDKVVLKDDDWDKGLPYVLFKWTDAAQGVVGVGIAKKLYYIQCAITFTLQKIFKGIKAFSTPRVFVPKGVTPTESDLTDLVGQIIEYNQPAGGSSGGIVFSTPPAANPQTIEILELLWRRAFEIVGISQFASAGKVPSGLKQASGIALRSYMQIENERFQLVRSLYEDNYIEIAKKVIDLVPGSFKPKGISHADLTEALDSLSIWASSILPETPAGKLATASDLLNAGLLTPSQTLGLLESPDTDKFLSSENSRIKAVELLIERALEKGERPVFYSALGLELYLDKVRKILAELIIDDMDGSEDKVAILQEFETELVAKVAEQTNIQQGLEAMQGQPQAGGPAPKGPITGLETTTE